MKVQHAAPAREAALEVLLRVERDRAFSHLSLSAALSRLTGRDRGLATELVYGTLAYRKRIDYALSAFASLQKTPPAAREALRMAAFQLLFLDRVPAHAILDDAVKQVRRLAGDKVSGFANAVLRKLSTHKEPALPEGQDAESLALRYSMPTWIVERRLRQLPPDEVEALLASELAAPPLTVRVRGDRAKIADILRESAEVEEGSLCEDALLLRGMSEIAKHPLFLSGEIVVQDEGAQAVVKAVAAPKGARVLDACAGFGGKSLALADAVGPTGSVVSIDLSEKKIQSLLRESTRLQISNIQGVIGDLRKATPAKVGRFSHVVLDAPCTALGTLRRHPELRWRRSEEDIASAADLQQQLLFYAAELVAPGGVLCYAVCSPEPEEGVQLVRRVVNTLSSFQVETPPSLAHIASPDGLVRLYPHRHQTDAFFLATLRRSS